MCDEFLIKNHKNELYDVLKNKNTNNHFSININFLILFDHNPSFGNKVLDEPDTALEELNKGAQYAQNTLVSELVDNGLYASTKKNVKCRVFALPVFPEYHTNIFPTNYDADKFLQISGTVIRASATKLLEYKREYICTKCKYKTICYAEYDKKYIISPPKKCSNPENYCTSTNLTAKDELQAQNCKDYQEIKVQERVSHLSCGTMPKSMLVTLEDDLVDFCKPGDDVTICGIAKRRWTRLYIGSKIKIELVMKANHIRSNKICGNPTQITPEIKQFFNTFWETYKNVPIIGRDIILKSFCPQIFGLHIVKLAIAVVLAGGSPANQDSSTGVQTRTEPHLLLVGDPGTGKSQLLRYASKVVPRSVLTTGVGSTAAGLTVTVLMDGGDWQLEGGALVLADGGICCIDEFNSMKEHDRTSIHEAMEQQTISLAKAGIVCTLNTRCSILAATNPKGNIDPFQPLCMNLALATPLLSRFDLIMLIRDTVQEDWDSLIADYILKDSKQDTSKFKKNQEWSLQMLQAYFMIIKKLHPPLSEEANRILASYYQLQRRQTFRNKSRTTVRLLESLVRISQGHAKLMFHNSVQTIDAIMAVVLMEIGMGYQEDSALNLNINVHSSFPDNSVENYIELSRNILEKLNLNDIFEQEIILLQSAINELDFRNNVRFESRCFSDEHNETTAVDIPNTSENSRNESIVSDTIKQNDPKSNNKMDKSIFQDENVLDDIDFNF